MGARVLIVDDDAEFRSALSAYVRAGGFRVEATAAHGIEALAALENARADIVLSDIRMPVMDGITLQREIRKLPTPPIFVAMTAFDTDELMIQLLVEGAAGYIVKSDRPEDVCGSLHNSLAGGTALSPSCVSRLAEHLRIKRTPRRIAELDAVDEAILAELSRGQSNARIARSLHYAESTIKNRVSRMLKVVGVESRAALIAWWLAG